MTGENCYLDLLRDVMKNGAKSSNRTGVDTYKVFGRFWTCEDVELDFPLLTTKRVHWKSVVAELIWFLSGSTNVKPLQAMGCTIWDEWADKDGELGPVYGKQWRRWAQSPYETHLGMGRMKWMYPKPIDQIANAIKLLKTDPDSRRILVSAWNVADLHKMKLQPCHYAFQFQTSNGDLNMMVNMRSTDIFLGLPFNIASDALLLKLVAHVTGYRAKRLCFSLGDLHLYENHYEQAATQIARTPRQPPRIGLEDHIGSIDDFRPRHIELREYDPHPAIKAKVAV